jgi:hypothetical protein
MMATFFGAHRGLRRANVFCIPSVHIGRAA